MLTISDLNISEIAAKPFGWGSAIRHRRFFHPAGVLARGSIERIAPPSQGLPVPTSDVVVRLSKAVGMPGMLPDAIGFAMRMPPERASQKPWDVLLASAGSSAVGRVVALRPVTAWAERTMTNLMPLQYQGRNWWLRARISTDIAGLGLSLDDVRHRLAAGGIEVKLDQACGTEDFSPLARLTLTRAIPPAPNHDVSFDPVLNTAPGVTLFPSWLADVRARAYARSRDGRDAG